MIARRATDKATGHGAIQRLMEYWAHGEGAAKIGWGTPNDFYRCRNKLRKYVRPDQLDGLCSNLHQRALGYRPNQGPHKAKSKD